MQQTRKYPGEEISPVSGDLGDKLDFSPVVAEEVYTVEPESVCCRAHSVELELLKEDWLHPAIDQLYVIQ